MLSSAIFIILQNHKMIKVGKDLEDHEVFPPEGSEAMEQVAQGSCGCPIPGGIQGQAGCGSGQPGLVAGDPAHSRGLELDDHCGPIQPRPFYDSMIIYDDCVIL